MAPGEQAHTFAITVDGDELSIAEHELTPRQIMKRAGIDPDTHYLVELRGDQQVSLQATPDDPIHIHEKLKLISVYSGPKPVS